MSEAADRFQRASDGFLARIETVSDGQWANVTPCPEWTVRDVVVHVINEQRRTLAQVRGHEAQPLHGVGVAEMGHLPVTTAEADLAAAWREVGGELTESMDDPHCLDVPIPTPVGHTPYRDIIDVLPADVLIHTWDVARATGGDENLDLDVVARVFEHLKPMDEMLRQPWAFGPKLTPPAGASQQTEFLCFVGRRP